MNPITLEFRLTKHELPTDREDIAILERGAFTLTTGWYAPDVGCFRRYTSPNVLECVESVNVEAWAPLGDVDIRRLTG